MTMKPPPPMPHEKGSTTPSTPAAATAASTALPPERSVSIAACVASGSTVAAEPPVPSATGVFGGSGTWARAGNAATKTIRTATSARPAIRDIWNGSLPWAIGVRLPDDWAVHAAGRKPDVQVVVVVDEPDDDAAGSVQRQIGADEDLGRAQRDEAVDELLGGHDVDLVGPPRGALEP